MSARHALLLGAAVVCVNATPATAAVVGRPSVRTTAPAAPPERAGGALEAAAVKAGSTGRAVAMSLIGLAFAVAATVLAFRRDFKEAAGVFCVGIIAILLAAPAGMAVLRDTVASLFGGQ